MSVWLSARMSIFDFIGVTSFYNLHYTYYTYWLTYGILLVPYLLTYYTYYTYLLTYLWDFTICSFEYTNAYLELSEAI